MTRDLSKVHPKNLQIGSTDCCNGKWATIPACMGDPVMTICTTCHNHCTITWRPMYENVAPGTWRKIDYSNSMTKNIKS
jgi:hypothetical protein